MAAEDLTFYVTFLSGAWLLDNYISKPVAFVMNEETDDMDSLLTALHSGKILARN